MNQGTSQREQQGAILITALILLAVLATLSLSSVTNSSLETRMAYNERQRQISHEAAEAGLRAGETWVRTAGNVDLEGDLSKFGNGTTVDGLYQAVPFIAGGSINSAPTTLGESGDAWICSGDGQNAIEVAVQLDSNLPRQPCFIVEYIGRTKLTDNGVIHSLQKLDYNDGVNSSNLKEVVFEITAVGWGYDANVFSIRRTTIRKKLN